MGSWLKIQNRPLAPLPLPQLPPLYRRSRRKASICKIIGALEEGQGGNITILKSSVKGGFLLFLWKHFKLDRKLKRFSSGRACVCWSHFLVISFYQNLPPSIVDVNLPEVFRLWRTGESQLIGMCFCTQRMISMLSIYFFHLTAFSAA